MRRSSQPHSARTVRVRAVARQLSGALLACAASVILSGCDAILAAYKLTAERAHADAASVPVAPQAPVEPRYADVAAAIRDDARTLVAEANLPGLSIAVGADDRLLWAEALGWSNIEGRQPMTTDTRLRIGTTSKALTAAAVGLLVARGQLDLDAPVQQLLPGLEPGPAPFTTRQAMAHTAGFTHFALDDHFEPLEQCDDMAAALRHAGRFRRRATAGDEWRYSSLGWAVVSGVVEAQSGQPFHRFVQQEVLAPLGMRSTAPDDFDDPPAGLAGIYWPRAVMDTSYGLEHPGIGNVSCFPGAVDYVSTPSDLVRFGMAMNRHALLDAQTTALLQAPVTLPSGRSTGHGLGWQVDTVSLGSARVQRVGHPGEAVGGTTVFHRYPELGLVVAVSSNVTFVELEPFATRVAERFAAVLR